MATVRALCEVESHTWLSKDDVELVMREVACVESVDHEFFTFAAKGFVSSVEVHQGGGDGKGVFNFRGTTGVMVTGNDAPQDLFIIVALNGFP